MLYITKTTTKIYKHNNFRVTFTYLNIYVINCTSRNYTVDIFGGTTVIINKILDFNSNSSYIKSNDLLGNFSQHSSLFKYLQMYNSPYRRRFLWLLLHLSSPASFQGKCWRVLKIFHVWPSRTTSICSIPPGQWLLSQPTLQSHQTSGREKFLTL